MPDLHSAEETALSPRRPGNELVKWSGNALKQMTSPTPLVLPPNRWEAIRKQKNKRHKAMTKYGYDEIDINQKQNVSVGVVTMQEIQRPLYLCL